MEPEQLVKLVINLSAILGGITGLVAIVLKWIDGYYKDRKCKHVEDVEALVSNMVHQKIPDYDIKIDELNKKREQDIRDLNEKRDRDVKEIAEKRERDLAEINKVFREFSKDFK